MEIETFFDKRDMQSGFMADERAAMSYGANRYFNASGANQKREEETAKAVYNTYPDTDDCQKIKDYFLKISSELAIRRNIATSAGASANQKKQAVREMNALENRKKQLDSLYALKGCSIKDQEAIKAAEQKEIDSILESVKVADKTAPDKTKTNKTLIYVGAGLAAMLVLVVIAKAFK